MRTNSWRRRSPQERTTCNEPSRTDASGTRACTRSGRHLSAEVRDDGARDPRGWIERLDTKAFVDEEEPSITGHLVDQMKALVEDRDAPEEWSTYAIHDDPPQSVHGRKGKKRPRIDVLVEGTGVRPRPRLRFEAKCLHRSNSVAEYVGDAGLGSFLSGWYAQGDPDAGMLGYVTKDQPDAWATKIATKLDKERAVLNLDLSGPVWHADILVPSLKHSYRTTHTRDGVPFEVHHVLIAFV